MRFIRSLSVILSASLLLSCSKKQPKNSDDAIADSLSVCGTLGCPPGPLPPIVPMLPTPTPLSPPVGGVAGSGDSSCFVPSELNATAPGFRTAFNEEEAVDHNVKVFPFANDLFNLVLHSFDASMSTAIYGTIGGNGVANTYSITARIDANDNLIVYDPYGGQKQYRKGPAHGSGMAYLPDNSDIPHWYHLDTTGKLTGVFPEQRRFFVFKAGRYVLTKIQGIVGDIELVYSDDDDFLLYQIKAGDTNISITRHPVSKLITLVKQSFGNYEYTMTPCYSNTYQLEHIKYYDKVQNLATTLFIGYDNRGLPIRLAWQGSNSETKMTYGENRNFLTEQGHQFGYRQTKVEQLLTIKSFPAYKAEITFAENRPASIADNSGHTIVQYSGNRIESILSPDLFMRNYYVNNVKIATTAHNLTDDTVTQYTFDQLERVVRYEYDHDVVIYEYNADNLSAAFFPNGESVNYSQYNSRQRPGRIVYNSRGAITSHDLTYDAEGRVTHSQTTLPNGKIIAEDTEYFSQSILPTLQKTQFLGSDMKAMQKENVYDQGWFESISSEYQQGILIEKHQTAFDAQAAITSQNEEQTIGQSRSSSQRTTYMNDGSVVETNEQGLQSKLTNSGDQWKLDGFGLSVSWTSEDEWVPFPIPSIE